MKNKQGIETLLQHFAEDRAMYSGAVVPPVFQNSLFTFESWDAIDKAFDDRVNNSIYTRGNNPTVNLAERKIAELAGGERAKLFGSGMAAISAALLHCLEPGDHILTINNLYGPANNLINGYLKKKINIEVSQVSGTEPDEFENSIRDNTKLIYLESPSTAVFSLQDIKAVAETARAKGIKTIIDNTWATPLFQKPLGMGIDLEVHSCSKYIGGHSDVVAGVVIGKEKDINDIYVNEFEMLGGIIAPYTAWLLIRSLRTLPIRMLKHQENAMEIAYFLEDHPNVNKVNYPGLESFPQHELGKKQMQGCSGLMSFELCTDDLDRIKAFVNNLEIFRIGVSWGGHESLVYAPAISYLKELSEEQFKAMGITLGDIRISVGLENSDDLMDDLDNALKMIE
ncbi:MAG: aminotransferase class I/II-fold pyridoxal phosphate-dependent enzyme [bacterium]|nr:aminotransferase class I/II-fold pyridoxal phosphate-dependent enzyme [bacterium]